MPSINRNGTLHRLGESQSMVYTGLHLLSRTFLTIILCKQSAGSEIYDGSWHPTILCMYPMVYQILGIWLELAPNHSVYVPNGVSDIGYMVRAGTQPFCVCTQCCIRSWAYGKSWHPTILCMYPMLYQILGIWLELAPNHSVYIHTFVSDLGYMVGAGTQPFCVCTQCCIRSWVYVQSWHPTILCICNVVSDLGHMVRADTQPFCVCSQCCIRYWVYGKSWHPNILCMYPMLYQILGIW